MNRAKNIKRLSLAWVLVAIFLGTLFNNAFFFHSHILSNGVVISHAHPFTEKTDSSAPFKSHKHTKYELVLINMVNNALFLLSFFLIAFSIFAIKSILFVIKQIGVPQTPLYIFPLGRAPPVL